jgi:hypothetical protein
MIRIALLCLLLSGCGAIVVPVVSPMTNQVSCCEALWRLNNSTSGSIEFQKSVTSWSIVSKYHHTF